MAKSILQVVVQGVDKLSGPIKKAGQSIAEFDNRTKKTTAGLKKFGKTALGLTATLAAVGLAGKKAAELGGAGAAVKQTGQSFEFLIKKVGASADLLDQLRTASKGTISDMDLMSSTATLLAGAQGDLAKELAASTPRLLEIAKAAQKLNPALGSTTFLYDSLALGVKRASPMILDNLGLTIRIGAANSAYAEELGKTVAELTAAEMKQALLNETLRAGAVLIEQAGGTTESATDEYKVFSAVVGNLTDNIKASVDTAMRPSMAAWTETALLLTTAVEVYDAYTLAVKRGVITQEKAKEVARQVALGEMDVNEALELVTEATRKARHAGTLHAEQQVVLRKTLHGTTAEVMEQSRVAAMAADAAARLASGIDGLAGSEQLVQLESKELAQILKDELALATDKTTQEIIDAEKELKKLTAEFLESGVASEEASQEITDLTIHIEDLKTKVNIAVPSVHELALGLGEIASAWDQAKIAMAPGLSLLEDVEEQIIDTSGSTEQWARVTDEVSLALGDKNYAIITAERRLRTLERKVKDNVVSFEDSEEAIIAARIALAEANAAFADSNVVVKDNTAILKDNTEERERAAGISDAYAKLIGRENEATLRLRDTIEMQTEAFEELGVESGFTEDGIAALMVQLDDMRDVLRESTRDSDRFADSLDLIGEGADKTTKSVSRMRAELIAAGGDWWATASDVQVADEYAKLSGGGGGDKTKTKTTPDLLPGQTSPDVSKGDTGQWGVEYGDQEGGWNEMFGEWQPGADHRSEEEHAKQVIDDMKSRHGFDPAAPQGWAMDFLRTGGGPGSGTGLIGRGFSDDAITAALKNAGGQHGLDMIVPSGFNRDNFMVGTTSGERVTVTPSHMLGGGSGGGLTVNTINVYGVQTASSLYEEVVKAARQRGRAFAKVM